MKRIKAIFLCMIMVVMMIPTMPVKASTSAKVQISSTNSSDQTNTLGYAFSVVNNGTESIRLSDVTLRFYFTNDGSQANSFSCDYSTIGSSNVSGQFGTLNYSTADRYLQLSFSSSAGQLAPGNSITVNTRIWKQDWSNFTQSNDYSYSKSTSFVDTSYVTLYLSGSLIWGTAPNGSSVPTTTPTTTPTATPTTTPTTTPSSSLVPKFTLQKKNVPSNAAMTFVKNMKIGWNLGNTMDATDATWLTNELDYESIWSGATTTKAMIDKLKSEGFNTIRIPVSWHNHVSGSDFKISDVWMNRVQQIVDYCIANNMYVILNIHHDVAQQYYYPTSTYLNSSKNYVTKVWTQIAARFKNYDEHLIFESLNEPRMVGHTNEWWIENNADCLDSINCINILNQEIVNVIRNSGGNNATRYIMCPGYDASPEGATHANFKLPTDLSTNNNKIIVSVHAYTPYSFALESPGIDYWSVNDQTSINNLTYFLDNLYNKYTSNGIPVVIGEFGAVEKNNNLKSRVEWASYYTAYAKARGITCVWWDNNLFSGEGERFGLLDRSSNTIRYPDIVSGMMYYVNQYQ